MTKKTDLILKQVLEKVNPSEEEMSEMKEILDKFLLKFGKKIKEENVKAEVFIGGSFAKGTVIKKDNYDIDAFVRFSEDISDEEMSSKVKKLLDGQKNVSRTHGSRDYFRVKLKEDLIIELVPVKKVSNSSTAKNITDLSYSHVKYINKKIKNKKILEEIKLAKAFCYANKCYGAESYINGFSGYALELLIYNYKSFEKFLKEMIKKPKQEKVNKNSKSKESNERENKIKNKIVIDIEKHYKNKLNILMDLNSSKLLSPIILIDPTFKQRNALAALSINTFERFKKAANKFLKNPSLESFELEKTDLEKIKKDAIKKKQEFILLEVKTLKQEGDIAGSKLLKFYRHFTKEIENYFEIKKKGFNYNGKKSARYYYVLKSKREIVCEGPFIKDEKNLKAFEKIHKNYITKKGRVYAKEKVDFNAREFFQKWIQKNKKKISGMSIQDFRIVEN